jgi:simple sugar transport system permease protein
MAGALVGVLHAYLSVTLRVDQLVSGLAINLSAAGLTAFGSRLVFTAETTQKLAGINAIALPGLSQIPIIGSLFFNQDLLVYGLFVLVPFTTYLLFRTSVGLTLRAVRISPCRRYSRHLGRMGQIYLRGSEWRFSGIGRCLSSFGICQILYGRH